MSHPHIELDAKLGATLFLTAIKYKLKENQKVEAFKFQSNPSGLRNVLLHIDKTSKMDLLHAVRFALVGHQDNENVIQVVAQVVDGSGDQWTIERSLDAVRYSKNKQVLPRETAEEEFIAAALDGDGHSLAEIVDIIDFSSEGGKLVARRRETDRNSQSLSFLVEKKVERIQLACGKFLGTSIPMAPQQLADFARSLRKVLHEHRFYTDSLDDLNKKFRSLAEFDVNCVPRLENELLILRQLGAEAKFFEDPANQYEMIYNSYRKVESQLSELCSKYEIQSLPMVDQEIDWEKVVRCLSRLQVYQKLESSYRKAQLEVEEIVKPIFNGHIKETKSFLLDDKKLLGRIQSALELLTKQMSALEPPAKEAPKGGLLKRFLEPDQNLEPKPTGVHPDLLIDSRKAVDTILASINNMCTKIEIASEGFGERVDEIQTRYERIVEEVGKAKSQWQKLASKYHIDPQASLRSILNLVNNFSQISGLYTQRKDLKGKLDLYQTNLKTVGKLIQEWRLYSKSQNKADLTQRNILLSEMRNLTRFTGKKEEQLKKLSKIQNRIELYNSIKGNLIHKLEICESEWRKTFQLARIELMPINGKDWDKFFTHAEKCLSTHSLIQESSRPVFGESIFSTNHLAKPLSIFVLKGSYEKVDRLEFIRCMEFCTRHSNILFLVQDQSVYDEFLDLNVGKSVGIPLRKAASKSENLPTNKKTEEAPISEKARAALELFKARNSSL